MQWVMMNEEVLIKNAVKNCTIMSEEITKECFVKSLLHRCVNSTCNQAMANLEAWTLPRVGIQVVRCRAGAFACEQNC